MFRYEGVTMRLFLTFVLAILFVGCGFVATPGEPGPAGPPGPPGPPGASASAIMRDGTRLRAMRWRSEDGLAMPGYGVFDLALNTLCGLGYAEDGERRCLPSGPLVRYIDEGCTQPVAGASCGVEFEPLFASEQVTVDSCKGPLSRVYELGAPVDTHNAVWLHVASSGVCAPAPVESGTYYEVGNIVAPEELAIIYSDHDQ